MTIAEQADSKTDIRANFILPPSIDTLGGLQTRIFCQLQAPITIGAGNLDLYVRAHAVRTDGAIFLQATKQRSSFAYKYSHSQWWSPLSHSLSSLTLKLNAHDSQLELATNMDSDPSVGLALLLRLRSRVNGTPDDEPTSRRTTTSWTTLIAGGATLLHISWRRERQFYYRKLWDHVDGIRLLNEAELARAKGDLSAKIEQLEAIIIQQQ